MSVELIQWVIYFDPSDYPGKYVARKWIVASGRIAATQVSYMSDSLEDARRHIPDGMFNLGRFANDDPKIVEVWT